MEWILYLCSIAGNIKVIFGVCAGLFILTFWCRVSYLVDAKDIDARDAFKVYKKYLYLTTLSLVLCALTPSTKECYFIFGVGSVVEYCTSSEEVKKLPNNTIKALNRYLESIQQDELEVTIKEE